MELEDVGAVLEFPASVLEYDRPVFQYGPVEWEEIRVKSCADAGAFRAGNSSERPAANKMQTAQAASAIFVLAALVFAGVLCVSCRKAMRRRKSCQSVSDGGTGAVLYSLSSVCSASA